MPYIEGLPDSSERWARNPETGKGEYVENMTFDEWKDYVNEEREIQLSQGKYGANLKYVRSDDFKSKVSLDYHTAAISDSIVNVSKRILQHRNGTPFEDYYLLDKKNGKIQAVSNQTHKIKGVNYNNSVRNAFKNGNKNQYISIHNHPSGYPPSLSDIAALSQVSKNGTVAMGLTIGHDGSMYWYTASAKKFKKNDNLNYGIRLKKNLHISYNEVVAQEATLAEFANKYGFKFGKIGD